jgi:small ligand-binding sensory domain FIST
MSVRIACELSTASDARAGALEASEGVLRALDGGPVDLAVVFASGAHLAAPETTIEVVSETLAPSVLVGCGAGGIIGAGREIEGGTGVSVWAASFDDGSVSSFHAEVHEVDDGVAVAGLAGLEGASGAILLPDAYSFPTDTVLTELHERFPGVPVLGGVSSARARDGGAALFCDEQVVSGGAVGVRFDGIKLLPCVSQGAAPLGPELEITEGEGRLIKQVGGKPALGALRAIIERMSDAERKMLEPGMLLGLVIEQAGGAGDQKDFLIRSVLGDDPQTGTIAVGATIAEGQCVRIHARNASSADRDLRDALSLRREALGSDEPVGALMFTCNGRGRGMFGAPDHDVAALIAQLGQIPAAGFFAAGEIGPVGGENFLHGFTATVVVFGP